MTIKSRLTKLESVSSEPWSDEPIIIRIRDKRKGAIQRPSTKFLLSAGEKKQTISRQVDESEQAFLERVERIGRENLMKPQSCNHVPPAVILFESLDSALES
ncbi:MAG: hypothetical protein ACJAVI_005309 [Candidatus Azotimanducaceae bacterium]|jgi:hypothetical protein